MSNDSSADAIKEIERLTKEAVGKTVEIAGRAYSTVKLHDPRRPEPEPECLIFSTLQSFADYVKSQIDEFYTADRVLFVHVMSPSVVRLCTGIFGEHNQRVELARAGAITPALKLGTFMDPETFIIGLLSKFDALGDRGKVFQIVGNLQSEQVQTVEDDGVTQRATARAGLVKRKAVEVPNPVKLAPFRSFAEIDQVISPFVLRLRGGSSKQPPMCALFECDGGLWHLEAIERIKAWLGGELSGIKIFG